MATIDQFKAQLTGGGARANQFRVTMNTPGAVATGLDARRTSFLVKSLHCLVEQWVKSQFPSEVEISTS